MNAFQAIMLGIIEGITEFLPISSTGHLILTGKLLGVRDSDFVKSFQIIIQFGAILSVIVLYARLIWFGGGMRLDRKILSHMAVAFAPTAVIGLLVYTLVKQYLLNNSFVVLWALLIGGVVLLVFEQFHRQPTGEKTLSDVTYAQAFGIGLFQTLAFIPGVSRAAATIVGGMLMGLPRRTIVEFSFLLAVPTMVAASGLDLIKNVAAFSHGDVWVLSIGFVTSFFAALMTIKWFLKFIQHHTFRGFAIYRIALAILLLFFWKFV